ncbi:MAG: tyrosine-type recombinase/integrase, partial [Solirubrobacterales bacterium]
MIAPKTRTSQRVTPLPDVLRDLLLDHRMRSEPSDDALVRRCGEPFHAASLYRRADDAWNAAGLPNRLRLQQVRHTFASLLIDAKVKAKAIQEFMGHA